MSGTKFESDIEQVASDSKRTPFDCVIVGGGSAGLTTARTIGDCNPNLRTLLLEAGPAPFLTHISNTELRFSRELSRNIRNQVQYSPKLPDGKPFGRNYGCLGGRGLFWNGAAPRFRDHDFSGWPLTPAQLDADYTWAEREFRVSRKLGESALATRIIGGLKKTGLEAEPGPFAVDIESLNSGELSAGIASGLGLFLRRSSQAVAEDRIKVAINSLAQRVLHEDGEAKGVLVSSADGKSHEVYGRSIVLAGGGIESVRIAALSDIPDPNRRIGVGIQEHLFYDCLFTGKHIYDDEDPDTAIVYVPSSSQTTEQWELHAPGRRLFTLDDGTEWKPSDEDPYRIMARSFCATDKRDENYVESAKGERGSATIHFGYTNTDIENKSRIAAIAKRIRDELGFEEVGDLAVDSVDRFRSPGSSYHEAGGLDMGTDPAKSVTDPDGCFHHIRNLVCMDAAAFPRIGATNPHLTIVAISRRKAKALAASLS